MIRLPDPFTHPGQAPGFQKAPLIDNEPLLQEEMPSGKVLQINNISAQYWSTRIEYPELYDDEYRIVMSAILEAKRTNQPLEIVLPQYVQYRIRGDFSQAQIIAGQQGNTVQITATDDIIGAPHVGDLFKLDTHSKVYMITGFSRIGNIITLNIYPDLFIMTTGAEKPVFNNISFSMKLMGRDMITHEMNADGMYEGVSFSFRESV